MFVTHVRHTLLSKATKQNQIKSCDEHEHVHWALIPLSYRSCHILLRNYLSYLHTKQNQIKSCDEHEQTKFCLKQQNRIRSKVVTNLNICIGHLTNWAKDHVIFCSQIISATYTFCHTHLSKATKQNQIKTFQGVVTGMFGILLVYRYVCHIEVIFVSLTVGMLPHNGYICHIM